MKKWRGRDIKRLVLALAGMAILMTTACGEKRSVGTELAVGQEDSISETGATYESAKDGEVDIASLQKENPDIFGWLYIPGTNIDHPVLQSTEADEYYESHNALGEEDDAGALYIELANLTDMCDFNTVIHGKTTDEGTMFSELYEFADPDFFEGHEKAFIYLDGNLLTYEIFAAFEQEDISLIRTYDFTWASGCQEFLDELYGRKIMGKNIRQGWEGVTPRHFLITLTTKKDPASDKQFIVVAGLVGDAAGNIDRLVE